MRCENIDWYFRLVVIIENKNNTLIFPHAYLRQEFVYWKKFIIGRYVTVFFFSAACNGEVHSASFMFRLVWSDGFPSAAGNAFP
jgi:hypothetical protein